MALDPTQPFTRAQALAAGITDHQLASPRYHRLHTSIYVEARVDLTPVIRARAALVAFGSTAFASHTTAARLWGLPLPTAAGEHVTVAAKIDRRKRAGVSCHHLPAGRQARLLEVDGVRVSAPEQVFVELASSLGLVDLVIVGDQMVRTGLVGLAQLRKHVAGWTGPGRAQARAAVAFVRERVDSPMETRLRLLIVLAGLPEPLVNITYSEDHGLTRRKYDLSWPEARLIVEYDGRHHVERVDQWESDLTRREAIDDSGWRILVVVASGIYTDPAGTLARIHRLLLQRGHPGVPKQLTPTWRQHFPGRP
jgi:very-short-patch-repair endonuclease